MLATVLEAILVIFWQTMWLLFVLVLQYLPEIKLKSFFLTVLSGRRDFKTAKY